MKQYKVHFARVSHATVSIEAESEEKAKEIVNRLVDTESITLCYQNEYEYIEYAKEA